jgi:hypothetical protein
VVRFRETMRVAKRSNVSYGEEEEEDDDNEKVDRAWPDESVGTLR